MVLVETTCLSRKPSPRRSKGSNNALLALPDSEEFREVRTALQSKIAEKKKVIVRSKPIGARVDACRQWGQSRQALRAAHHMGAMMPHGVQEHVAEDGCAGDG